MSYIYSIATHYHIINERERGSWHKIKVMPRTLLIVRITTFLMVVAGFSSWVTPDHNHPFIDVTIRTCDGTRGGYVWCKKFTSQSRFLCPHSRITRFMTILNPLYSDQQFDTGRGIYLLDTIWKKFDGGRDILAICLMVH